MTALPWTRRRSEHFDALLESGRLDSGAGDGVDDQTAELLELVGALRSVPVAEARPEFVTGLRERLMVAAETELTAAPAGRERDVARLTIKPARTRREKRVGVALGAVAIVGASTSMAVASQSAIPGDALYPLKRAIENTQAGFSVSDDAKGRAILDNASGRLDELDELTSRPDPDAGLVSDTLDTFSAQFSEGADHLIADYQASGDEQSIAQLHQAATGSLDILSDLEPLIPASAHDALLDAAQTVLASDSVAAQVCPQCGEPILELPGQLLAGVTTELDQTTETVAGGELPGTGPASESPKPDRPQNGGKDDGRPSAANPPASPVTIPSTPPSPTEQTGGGLGDGLPTIGTNTSGGHQSGGQSGGSGGGKGKGKPVDLGPVTGTVTDTVNEVVDGVVEGVNGLLNGLSGGQTGK